MYHNYELVVEFETLTAVNVKSDIIWNVYGITSQRIRVACFIKWLLSLCVRITCMLQSGARNMYNLLYKAMFCNISHCVILRHDISLYMMRYVIQSCVMLRCHFMSCYVTPFYVVFMSCRIL